MSPHLPARAVRASVAIVLSASALTLIGASSAAAAGVTRVYASPHGAGKACSAPQPCSLTAAKAAAAEAIQHSPGDVHVELAGGTYQLGAPLDFGPQDSGSNGHRIIWEAQGAMRPVLSGGVPITGWHASSSNPQVWVAPVPAGLSTRQLYADGTRIPRSSGQSPVGLTQTADGFLAADDTLASWRNPSSLEFVFDGGHGAWTQPRCDVASISGRAITMRQPCWSNMKLPSTPLAPDGDNPSGGFPSLDSSATPSRIENAYELLSPGTWYLDQSRNEIYYDARPGQDVSAMQFQAPVLQQLIRTSSTAEQPLHDVTFNGITFAYTTWLTPSSNDGFPDMQATMYLQGPNASNSQGLCNYVQPTGTCPFAAWTRPPAAVDLVGTRNVTVSGSTFEHLGAAGLGAYHGARDDVFTGNEISDVSGNGIEFGTTDDPQPTAFAADISGGAPATQSSTQSGGSAMRAVDGSSSTSSQTRQEQNPWWQADLGSVRPLWQTNITAGQPLGDYWVFASSTPFDTRLTPQQQATRPGVWSSQQSAGSATGATVPTDASGRYLMIQLVGDRSLSLANVSVKSGAEIAVGNTISDNYVHNIGVEYTGAVGIWGGYSRRTTITHNEVGDLPYSGISFGWAGWHTNATTPLTNPNVMADNVISDNVIYNVMGVRSDGGPIYTNGPQGQSLEHGLTISGNVTFGNAHTSFANYNDEGGAYITMDGNVQYADGGYFNGGCSTTGHIIVKNSYRVGPLNYYICDNVGTDFVDGGNNTLLPANPGVGVIPARVLAGAALQGQSVALSTATAPEVAVVSPIQDHQVLISGRGFTPGSQVRIGAAAATQLSYIGPNQLAATLPADVYQGDVAVTTGAGTSPITSASYTYDPTLDVAVGKPATQSSTAFGSPAGHAVDGNTSGSYGAGSLSHTDDNTNAWWQVDLGSSQQIASINLWNRSDCCADRASDYWVFVSDAPFDTSLTPAQQAAQPGVWSSHQTSTMGRPTQLPVAASGRYVMVQLSGTNYLALAEVQVFRNP
ncbi:MAG: parallel beta-helix repeat protein [Frankiales bacterium]|nr:parallel beta-helix repeat protein [Frankiales bacterium]